MTYSRTLFARTLYQALHWRIVTQYYLSIDNTECLLSHRGLMLRTRVVWHE